MPPRLASTDRRASLIAAAMLLAAAVNLYQFAQIDAARDPHHKALYANETFAVDKLGQGQFNIEVSTNLFSVIGQAAPGAKLVMTTPEPGREKWFRRGMLSIGRIEEIEICELDADAAGLFDPAPKLSATGKVWADISRYRRKVPGLTWAVGELSARPELLLQVKTREFDALIIDNEFFNLKLHNCK